MAYKNFLIDCPTKTSTTFGEVTNTIASGSVTSTVKTHTYTYDATINNVPLNITETDSGIIQCTIRTSTNGSTWTTRTATCTLQKSSSSLTYYNRLRFTFKTSGNRPLASTVQVKFAALYYNGYTPTLYRHVYISGGITEAKVSNKISNGTRTGSSGNYTYTYTYTLQNGAIPSSILSCIIGVTGSTITNMTATISNNKVVFSFKSTTILTSTKDCKATANVEYISDFEPYRIKSDRGEGSGIDLADYIHVSYDESSAEIEISADNSSDRTVHASGYIIVTDSESTDFEADIDDDILSGYEHYYYCSTDGCQISSGYASIVFTADNAASYTYEY